MNRTPRTLTLIATALLAAAGAAQAQQTIDHNKALAGNITPGDAPGYPITITRSGHYKLMGNLTVPAGLQAIFIQADDVTLDLNGFTVAGPGTCVRAANRAVTCQGNASQLPGITDPFTAAQGVVVRNGTVRGFGYGISLSGSAIVQDMFLTQNAISGVSVANGRVDRVVAMLNGLSGVTIGRGTVANSVANNNGQQGVIRLGDNPSALVVDTVAQGNFALGIQGPSVRGTLLHDNGQTNRNAIRSLGGNADANGVY
ncbi:hypothetical protein ACPOLB_00305 [Rubrivivax sp. RP6-9]|uniref:hypothetical protein n=1 Tax=Rubrivivax sp. RP6-9 TaxID=3415750 RepID=UPI003CC61051